MKKKTHKKLIYRCFKANNIKIRVLPNYNNRAISTRADQELQQNNSKVRVDQRFR